MKGSERWAALEIRLLAAFSAVAETGSFAAAARRLGYTQSGISQQIAALERIVGRKLLVRHAGGRRPVEPTAAGRLLLAHSRSLLAAVDRAYDELAADDRSGAHRVTMAAFSSVAVRVLPKLLRTVRAQSDLTLEIVEDAGDEQLLARVDSGEAELAFAVLPVPSRFVVEEVGSDPYVLLVPSASRLAERAQVAVPALAGLPVFAIRLCPHEQMVEAHLAAAGLATSQIQRYDNNQLIQSLVGGGGGVAIVPSLTVDHADDDVCVVSLQSSLPPRSIGLIHLRDRLLSPAARALRPLALAVCRQTLRGVDLPPRLASMRRAG